MTIQLEYLNQLFRFPNGRLVGGSHNSSSPSFSCTPSELQQFSIPGIATIAPECPSAIRGIACGLVLIYPDGGEYKILLTKRSETMTHLPGRIEFPGGTRDAEEDFLAAALRETREETGIQPSKVNVVQELTPVLNCESNFWVKLWFGVLESRPRFQRQASEIAAILEIPVLELLDTSSRRNFSVVVNNRQEVVPGFSLSGQRIWGGTALTLNEIKLLLRGH